MKRKSIKEMLLRKWGIEAGIPSSLIDRFIGKKSGHGHNHEEEDESDELIVQRSRVEEPVLPFPPAIERNLTESDVSGPTIAVLEYPKNRGIFPEVKALLVDIDEEATSVEVETTKSQSLHLNILEIAPKYKPVFELLSKTNNRFIFTGYIADDERFHVCQVHVHKSGRMMRSYEAERVVHEKQLQHCLKLLAGEEVADDVVFKTAPEFRLLLLCAPHECFPDCIRAWANSELDVLEEGGIGEDSRKQAVAALSILNIDWRDRQLDLPNVNTFRNRFRETIEGQETIEEALVDALIYMRSSNGHMPKSLCFVGPPGVGKTVAMKLFADLLGVNFLEVDFSTNHDSNTLTGSGRLYSNGQPGKIARAMLKNRSKYLVLLVNEIDKASATSNAEHVITDPREVLLSIAGHEDLIDDYIEAPMPTDHVFVVCTCNDLSNISDALLSRFRIVEVAPYSVVDKKIIFDRHILPRTLRRANLPEDAFRLTDKAVDLLMKEVAIEPGVRDLEKAAERLAVERLREIETTGGDKEPRTYTTDDIVAIFGGGKQHVPIVEAAGEAIGLYQQDGAVWPFKIQVDAVHGSGRFDTINIGAQYGFCKSAYIAAKGALDEDLESYDITVSLTSNGTLLPETKGIGLATAAAIYSAVTGVALSSHEIFVADSDLFGNVLGGVSPLAAVKATVGRGCVLYAERGFHTYVHCHHDGIIEVDTIEELFSWLDKKGGRNK